MKMRWHFWNNCLTLLPKPVDWYVESDRLTLSSSDLRRSISSTYFCWSCWHFCSSVRFCLMEASARSSSRCRVFTTESVWLFRVLDMPKWKSFVVFVWCCWPPVLASLRASNMRSCSSRSWHFSVSLSMVLDFSVSASDWCVLVLLCWIEFLRLLLKEREREREEKIRKIDWVLRTLFRKMP